MPLDELSEAALAVPADDVIMDRKQERAERRRTAADMVVKLKDKLTETQFRRLWMYEVENKTMEEIAAIEGISAPAVFYSIESAHKKISKFFLTDRKLLKI